MTDITEEFIKAVLYALPPEGVEKLNVMVDNNKVSVDEVSKLLAEYGVNQADIIKGIKGESK